MLDTPEVSYTSNGMGRLMITLRNQLPLLEESTCMLLSDARVRDMLTMDVRRFVHASLDKHIDRLEDVVEERKGKRGVVELRNKLHTMATRRQYLSYDITNGDNNLSPEEDASRRLSVEGWNLFRELVAGISEYRSAERKPFLSVARAALGGTPQEVLDFTQYNEIMIALRIATNTRRDMIYQHVRAGGGVFSSEAGRVGAIEDVTREIKYAVERKNRMLASYHQDAQRHFDELYERESEGVRKLRALGLRIEEPEPLVKLPPVPQLHVSITVAP